MNVELHAFSQLPTRFGTFKLYAFRDSSGLEHPVLACGHLTDGCLVRLHSECTTGDVLGSLRCDCRDQLELSMRKIDEAGQGLVIYLRGHEGRGIGLANKVKAYALQDQGMDTVEANTHLGFPPDQRNYDAAIGVLNHFKLREISLLTNNRGKIAALEQAGIKVTRQVALWTASNPNNEKYLATKRGKLGHIK